MTAKPRKVFLTPAVRKEFQRIKDTERRGAEAIKGFQFFVSRKPELGNSVYGAPGFLSRPFHTDEGSYLVVYEYDDATVTCIAVRSIPSPRDTYY